SGVSVIFALALGRGAVRFQAPGVRMRADLEGFFRRQGLDAPRAKEAADLAFAKNIPPPVEITPLQLRAFTEGQRPRFETPDVPPPTPPTTPVTPGVVPRGPKPPPTLGAAPGSPQPPTRVPPTRIPPGPPPEIAEALKAVGSQRGPAPKPEKPPLWDRFYTQALDRLTPIRRAVEGLTEKGKPRPSVDENAYDLARLYAGWPAKADHFLNQGTFDPITLERTGGSLRELLRPVERELDPFQNYLISLRAIEKNKQTTPFGPRKGEPIATGVNLTAAELVVRHFDAVPRFRKAKEALDAYQEQTLLYIQKSGFLSKDQVSRIQAMNRDYVPFYRLDPRVFTERGIGKPTTNIPQPVKRMKGSELPIVDPLDSIIKNTFSLINKGDRNRVTQALVAQARQFKGAQRWIQPTRLPVRPTRLELNEIKTSLRDAGFELEGADLDVLATIFRPSQQQPPNVLSVWVRGKQRQFKVAPELFTAMEALDVKSLGMG
ncbi:hypothetical protein LCGC14_2528220, partial [marine sediment metagenome]